MIECPGSYREVNGEWRVRFIYSEEILFNILTDGINRTLNPTKRPFETNFLMLTVIYAGTRKHQRTGSETQFC